jgi:NAD(P)-dependent dehydrogenase (short-subunit alcohol dehydrogenase family)
MANKLLNTGRVALLSGGSRGIGLAIAQELLDNGWRVGVGSREPVGQLSHYPEDKYLWCRFDALDPRSEDDWVASAAGHFGKIDAIVHNAGVLSKKSVVDASDEEFDAIFDINVKSPMRLTRKVWPYLSGSSNGKVVIIASLAGKRVRSDEGGLYSMSKAAALMLAHGIRHAGEASGVRCTAICPGFVATDMAADVDAELKDKLTQSEDVARIARFALELPATASVAEIPVNWRIESTF